MIIVIIFNLIFYWNFAFALTLSRQALNVTLQMISPLESNQKSVNGELEILEFPIFCLNSIINVNGKRYLNVNIYDDRSP